LNFYKKFLFTTTLFTLTDVKEDDFDAVLHEEIGEYIGLCFVILDNNIQYSIYIFGRF